MLGAAITDCSVFANYMDYRLGVLAGQDIWDGYTSGMDTLSDLSGDVVIVTACRLATKHIVYSVIHSHAMNVGHAEIVSAMPWWQAAIVAAMVAFGVLAVASGVMLTLSVVRGGREKEEKE